MKRLTLVSACCLCGLLISCSSITEETKSSDQISNVQTISRIDNENLSKLLELVNNERKAQGINPLSYSSELARAAELHSIDMGVNESFGHAGSDGSRLSERVDRQGYRWSALGENVAAGQLTPESVFESWMKSPKHKENILSDKYTEVGFGVYEPTVESAYRIYWTQVFAAPANSYKELNVKRETNE